MLYRDWGLCMIGRNKNWSGPSDWMEEFNKKHNPHLYAKNKIKKKKIKEKTNKQKNTSPRLKNIGE